MVDYSMNGYNWPLTCASGKEQSPIDLPTIRNSSSRELAIRAKGFKKMTGELLVETNGLTMALSKTDGQFDIIDPVGRYSEFEPYQMNIKSPSEHSKNGLTYDAEMQIMFTKKGDMAKGGKETRLGLSIFFDATTGGMQTNEFIQSLKIDTNAQSTMTEIGRAAVAKARKYGKTAE